LIRRNSDNKLVLVDFGAVKQIHTQLATAYGQASNTVAVGTPGYMASEQARGQPRPSSDIYALGIIGIQALTGLMPMQMQEDMNTGELLWEHLVSPSRGLVTIINRMVRYHFKERYQSATEALQALQQLNAPYKPLPQTVPIYSSEPPLVNRVPNSGKKLPPANNPPLKTQRRTLPVSPAQTPGKSVVVQPDDIPDSTSHNLAPIIISMALVGGLFGMAFALRPNSFASLFGGDRNHQTIDASQRSCTVITDTLNVRSGPGENNDVVDTVYNGSSLVLTGVSKDNWVQISSPKNGWVSRKWISCNSTKQAPVEAKATPTPVETPKPKPVVVKPKPPVDKGSDVLAKADEQYQNGDLEGAIAQAKKVIDSGSASAKDAQEKIIKWQKDWSEAKAKYDRVQKALDEGRWDEVIRESVDPKLLQQSYWRERLNQLIEEAKKRQAAAEAEAKKGGTIPPEQPQPAKPNSQSTDTGKQSSGSTKEAPATP
jgi:serine/threonine-protein kinase